MGFFGGLFGGSNPTLNKGINTLGGTAGFEDQTGQSLTSDSADFVHTLLSGNTSDTAKLLAPQIGAIQDRGQQQKNGLAEFGGRSGGTTSAAAGIDANTQGEVTNLVGNLTGQAEQQAGSEGQGLLNAGTGTTMDQAKLSQQQLQNWMDSILGQGASSGIGGVEGFGIGKL